MTGRDLHPVARDPSPTSCLPSVADHPAGALHEEGNQVEHGRHAGECRFSMAEVAFELNTGFLAVRRVRAHSAGPAISCRPAGRSVARALQQSRPPVSGAAAAPIRPVFIAPGPSPSGRSCIHRVWSRRLRLPLARPAGSNGCRHPKGRLRPRSPRPDPARPPPGGRPLAILPACTIPGAEGHGDIDHRDRRSLPLSPVRSPDENSRITFRYPASGVMRPILHGTDPCTGTGRDQICLVRLRRGRCPVILPAGSSESVPGGRPSTEPVHGRKWHRFGKTCRTARQGQNRNYCHQQFSPVRRMAFNSQSNCDRPGYSFPERYAFMLCLVLPGLPDRQLIPRRPVYIGPGPLFDRSVVIVVSDTACAKLAR